MAMDVEEQVLNQVKKLKDFIIHVDESTDLSNCTIFICFDQYKNDDSIMEELFCCLKLPGRTTNSNIFGSLNNYL